MTPHLRLRLGNPLRKPTRGPHRSNVVAGVVCEAIIAVYLWNNNTGWPILLPCAVGLVIQFWGRGAAAQSADSPLGVRLVPPTGALRTTGGGGEGREASTIFVDRSPSKSLNQPISPALHLKRMN